MCVQKGDLIQIIRKHPSGIWEGECAGRVGRFKFINVEELEEQELGKKEREQELGTWEEQAADTLVDWPVEQLLVEGKLVSE